MLKAYDGRCLNEINNNKDMNKERKLTIYD